MVSWNCRGYLWRRGPRLGPIARNKDIIRLTETQEHDECRTLGFVGYKKITIWNKVAENSKGHGGIMILIKEKGDKVIEIEKQDENK